MASTGLFDCWARSSAIIYPSGMRAGLNRIVFHLPVELLLRRVTKSDTVESTTSHRLAESLQSERKWYRVCERAGGRALGSEWHATATQRTCGSLKRRRIAAGKRIPTIPSSYDCRFVVLNWLWNVVLSSFASLFSFFPFVN